MPAVVETKPKKRKPNVFDVARLAGVSQTTVSFVLNGSTTPRISEATSQRVLDAVQQLGYRPNTLAKGLAHGKTNTVGMVLPFFDQDYHGLIVKECHATLAAHGYQLLFVHAQSGSRAEANMVEFLLQHRVDAIACFAHTDTTYILPEWLETINGAGIPAVVIDNTSPLADSVYSDDLTGMDAVIEHLTGLGHRRICLLSKRWAPALVPDKIKGFEAAMAKRGLDSTLRIGEDADVVSKERYSAEMVHMLKSAEPPTAFVGFNDYQFEHFVQTHMGRDVDVPSDVSIVGYGDSYLARLIGITSVCQNPEAIGRSVAERLLGHLGDPTQLVKRVEVPTKLVIRKSTGFAKS